ncbi:hypothetical protein GCM10020219_024160 [Nonomuraea dietziae]
MLLRARPLGALAAEQQQRLVPESATEWIDSASIEEEVVNRKATNFATAIARFAANAAMIALRPTTRAQRISPLVPLKIPGRGSYWEVRDFSSVIAVTGVGSMPYPRAR